MDLGCLGLCHKVQGGLQAGFYHRGCRLTRHQHHVGRRVRQRADGGGVFAVFFRFGQSPLSAPDLITDFAFGTDKIDVFSPSGAAHVAPTRFSRAANHAFATTPLALAAAVFADANGALPGNQALAANSAVLVRASNASIGGTYLVINNATTGRSDSDDLMIKLTGSTGPLPALGSLLPGTVFV